MLLYRRGGTRPDKLRFVPGGRPRQPWSNRAWWHLNSALRPREVRPSTSGKARVMIRCTVFRVGRNLIQQRGEVSGVTAGETGAKPHSSFWASGRPSFADRLSQPVRFGVLRVEGVVRVLLSPYLTSLRVLESKPRRTTSNATMNGQHIACCVPFHLSQSQKVET